MTGGDCASVRACRYVFFVDLGKTCWICDHTQGGHRGGRCRGRRGRDEGGPRAVPVLGREDGLKCSSRRLNSPLARVSYPLVEASGSKPLHHQANVVYLRNEYTLVCEWISVSGEPAA